MKFTNLYTNESHATILFADGEVNITKGRDLLWSRSMHCTSLPVLNIDDVPAHMLEYFNDEYCKVPCILLNNDSDDEIEAYRTELYSHITDIDMLRMVGYTIIHGYTHSASMSIYRDKLFNRDTKFTSDVVQNYQACKNNQQTIKSYIKEYTKELKGDTATKKFITWCLAKESLDWWMLDDIRRLKEEFKQPDLPRRLARSAEHRNTLKQLLKLLPTDHKDYGEYNRKARSKWSVYAHEVDDLGKIVDSL